MEKIARWEAFEITLHSPKTWANPFLDVALCADFTDGTGAPLRVDGFFDGDGCWKIRFAPMREGAWQYQTFSNDESLHGQKGEFSCTPPISRGGLTVNPAFPRWFARADGEPGWIVNDGWYPHPLFGFTLPFEGLEFPKPTEEDMRTYLKILGDHKVNMTIEVDQLYARQSKLEDATFNWPWEVVDAQTNRIDKNAFNLDFYRRMDRTLAYAKEQGVFYGFELLFDNSVSRVDEWSHHPLNRKNGGWLDADANGTGWGVIFDLDNAEYVAAMERYLRYTVARFGAYWNVYWALGAESGNLIRNPVWDMDVQTLADWYGHWGDFVARRDVHGRLQAIGDTGEQTALIYHPRNQFTITQEHTSMDELQPFCDATNAFGERFWQYGRPSIIGEQDRHNCNKYDPERKGYWVAFASGFYMGRVDRHFGVAENGRLIESDLFGLPGIPPIYPDLLRMTEFVEQSGIPYWRMEPCDAALLLSEGPVYCLAEPGETYLVYFAAGGSAKLNLPACRETWYNPRTGGWKHCPERKAGEHTLRAPDEEDWAVYLAALPAQHHA